MNWNRICLVCVMGLIGALYANIDAYSDDATMDQWIHYATTDDGTQFLYNKTRLAEVKPKVIQVLEMEILSQKAKDETIQIRKKYNSSIEGWDKLSITAHLREVNCMDRTLRWIKSIEADDKGNRLDSMEYSDTEISSITPGSVGDLLFTAVCPRGDEQKPVDVSKISESKKIDKKDIQPGKDAGKPVAEEQQ